ncbi:hypothetical protein [Leptospira kanakyensis]|uniref:Uncharacterized protein n=1 Tax=Leptospira kanakyensis TaxID=2484968 RepID=A0A6N4PRC1_9LEPT|nr:hypothetical protein [Leptospira kanakyensis]MCW7481272.1 hypothetical protein [Leptospira kanakyensis]TGK46093.1 hypothetical protein EHQ11_19290 [Leptospira kanakyensis]TGK65030.1 hypothetical protein EHQ16_00300 [Leptospira kanakyensis]TGK65462.1 hypothetical protein EHQ18_19510 [Leptospira kanakyensis]
MNTINIQGNSHLTVPPPLPTQTGKQSEDGKESLPEKSQVARANKNVEKEQETKVKPEDLVLKPTPASLEEKLNQIISPEEVKDLLSLVTRTPLPEPKNHKVDTKR